MPADAPDASAAQQPHACHSTLEKNHHPMHSLPDEARESGVRPPVQLGTQHHLYATSSSASGTTSTISNHKPTASSSAHGAPVAAHAAGASQTGVRTGAVAMGTAAADPCMLFGVASRDSVSTYASRRATLLPQLLQQATVQERKEHVEEQLNRVTNKVIGGSLLVLPGQHHRLAGGAPHPVTALLVMPVIYHKEAGVTARTCMHALLPEMVV